MSFFFLGKYIPEKSLGTSPHSEDGPKCKVGHIDCCMLTQLGHRVRPTYVEATDMGT